MTQVCINIILNCELNFTHILVKLNSLMMKITVAKRSEQKAGTIYPFLHVLLSFYWQCGYNDIHIQQTDGIIQIVRIKQWENDPSNLFRWNDFKRLQPKNCNSVSWF